MQAARDGRGLGSPLVQGTLIALVACLGLIRSTRLADPPRFDGAGYSVLARSLASGQGYREIDHPDRPRHAHYPPGYPLALAGLWTLTGPSAASAHAFSMACALAATLATWWWFRLQYAPGIAGLLGLALAVNWRWARDGGAIQSEPLFLLLGAVSLLLADRVRRRGGMVASIGLGLVLGAATLTRHVGVMLAVSIGLSLFSRGRRTAAVAALVTCGLVIAPWILWLASVRQNTQVGLLPRSGLSSLVAEQALFYLRRFPDQITGPLVEIGTVFRPSLHGVVTAWATIASAVILWGWRRIMRVPGRRLAGLVPLATLALLLVWPFTEAGRFLVPLVPVILIGATEGLASLAARWRARKPRRKAAALVLLASLPYAAYALATNRAEAQQRSHAAFDAACGWIAARADRPGPILASHAGEVFWQTGRQALSPTSDDPATINQLIDRYQVAYLLVDEQRYANAPAHPLARFVARGQRARRVWSDGPITVYERTDR